MAYAMTSVCYSSFQRSSLAKHWQKCGLDGPEINDESFIDKKWLNDLESITPRFESYTKIAVKQCHLY